MQPLRKRPFLVSVALVLCLLGCGKSGLRTQSDVLWTRTYGGSGNTNDWGNSVQQTADGGFVVVANMEVLLMLGSSGEGGVWLIRTDAHGDTLWTRTYGGSGFNTGNSVQQTADGGFVVVGSTTPIGADAPDVWLIRTDAQGDTLWTRTYGRSGYTGGSGNSVQQTADGGFVVAGQSGSFGAGVRDIWLIRTDAQGDTLWTRTYGGSGIGVANSVQLTADGGFVMVGSTTPIGADLGDVWLIRLGPPNFEKVGN